MPRASYVYPLTASQLSTLDLMRLHPLLIRALKGQVKLVNAQLRTDWEINKKESNTYRPLYPLGCVKIISSGVCYIITHGEKMTGLEIDGRFDKPLNADELSIASNKEVISLVNELTEEQAQTILTHKYFEQFRLDALLVDDDGEEEQEP
jgi:hypothetical protein